MVSPSIYIYNPWRGTAAPRTPRGACCHPLHPCRWGFRPAPLGEPVGEPVDEPVGEPVGEPGTTLPGVRLKLFSNIFNIYIERETCNEYIYV